MPPPFIDRFEPKQFALKGQTGESALQYHQRVRRDYAGRRGLLSLQGQGRRDCAGRNCPGGMLNTLLGCLVLENLLTSNDDLVPFASRQRAHLLGARGRGISLA